MDYRAALILEDALESAPLRSLDLSENPLGQAALHLCMDQALVFHRRG